MNNGKGTGSVIRKEVFDGTEDGKAPGSMNRRVGKIRGKYCPTRRHQEDC